MPLRLLLLLLMLLASPRGHKSLKYAKRHSLRGYFKLIIITFIEHPTVNNVTDPFFFFFSSASGQASCADIQQQYSMSGVYKLSVENVSMSVYCDLVTDGGGWTVRTCMSQKREKEK